MSGLWHRLCSATLGIWYLRLSGVTSRKEKFWRGCGLANSTSQTGSSQNTAWDGGRNRNTKLHGMRQIRQKRMPCCKWSGATSERLCIVIYERVNLISPIRLTRCARDGGHYRNTSQHGPLQKPCLKNLANVARKRMYEGCCAKVSSMRPTVFTWSTVVLGGDGLSTNRKGSPQKRNIGSGCGAS